MTYISARSRIKSKSATKILNMLRRNLFFAPKSVKLKAFKICVLPILEYASCCWSPTSQKSNNTLEMVQHNAAKFIANIYHKKGTDYKPYSITKLLWDLELKTIVERRTQARLTMAYKILNGYVILEQEMLPKPNQRLSRNCNAPKVGMKYQLFEPQPRLHVSGKTYFFNVPSLWNNLVTPSQANSPSVEAFQQYFKK